MSRQFLVFREWISASLCRSSLEKALSRNPLERSTAGHRGRESATVAEGTVPLEAKDAKIKGFCVDAGWGPWFKTFLTKRTRSIRGSWMPDREMVAAVERYRFRRRPKS